MFFLQDVKYKDVLDISHLELSEQEVFCIVGPSGGGKTTLLKLLNNLISVDKGQVLYQNKDVEEWDPIELRRRVVMVSQKPITFTSTIAEELKVGFDLTGQQVPKQDKMIELLERMQLDKDLSAEVNQLSGGEKQRLALVRSLLLNPEVLLLDEPSSALDRATEEKVIEEIINYAAENGIILIMVTHSVSIAQNCCSKIIKIENGKIAG
ncbi:MAG: ABC transporter ATP-binding protein [Bacillota bacterium]